jgi:Lrp/AsnC family transcriptional regulator, leucine-responsive regulatory protein
MAINRKKRHETPSLDGTDVVLLKALQDNARITVAELADVANLSTSPCWRRVKRLEEVGVIEGYRVALNRRALGWGVMAFVSVTIEEHDHTTASAFEEAVAAYPEIVACWSVAGTSDFLLQVVAADLDAYAEFSMSDIRRFPGIKAMHTTFTLKEIKAPTPWPLGPVER